MWGFRIAAAVLLASLIKPVEYLPSGPSDLFDPCFLSQALDKPGNLRAPRSPFDPLIRKHASLYKVDWRLVLGMVDTESRFQEAALSPVGAMGLMQLMPVVVRAHGLESAFQPEGNIAAGVRHFAWLRGRLKGRTSEDRLQLALAAYNSGLGHVRDAQMLALKLKKSPRVWKDVRDAMLLLEQPAYFAQAKYGYMDATQTVQYVDRVLDKYDAFKTRFPEDSVFLTQAPALPGACTV